MSVVPYVHLDVPLAGRVDGAVLPVGVEGLHHLTRVLRLRDGAELIVSDGQGGETSAILRGGEVMLTAVPSIVSPSRPWIGVAQALTKGRKLDEVVRQVVELGTDAVVPVAAQRSVVRLAADRADKAVERWRVIARAAAEQSRRPHRPQVHQVVASAGLVQAMDVLGGDGQLLVAVPGAPPLPAVLAELGTVGGQVMVAVGPEGGWSDDEVASFQDAGGRAVGLGPTVLRTEHAAAAAVAVIGSVLGRWG